MTTKPKRPPNQGTLRLITARLFTVGMRDAEFRSKFILSTGWTPSSPVVPCEAETLFGEVHAIAMPALRDTGSQVVAIPVLHVSAEKSEKSLEIGMSILTMGIRHQVQPCAESSIDIDSISHKVTMAQVVETLAPNKKWEIADLAAAYADLTCRA